MHWFASARRLSGACVSIREDVTDAYAMNLL